MIIPGMFTQTGLSRFLLRKQFPLRQGIFKKIPDLVPKKIGFILNGGIKWIV
jgi:hypothetical protein